MIGQRLSPYNGQVINSISMLFCINTENIEENGGGEEISSCTADCAA